VFSFEEPNQEPPDKEEPKDGYCEGRNSRPVCSKERQKRRRTVGTHCPDIGRSCWVNFVIKSKGGHSTC